MSGVKDRKLERVRRESKEYLHQFKSGVEYLGHLAGGAEWGVHLSGMSECICHGEDWLKLGEPVARDTGAWVLRNWF